MSPLDRWLRHVSLQAHISGQHSFPVEGKLLAFNGPKQNGHKLILAQVYSEDPPGAFVLTFSLKKPTWSLRHGDEHDPA